MNYKVGDRVKIQSLERYNKYKNRSGDINYGCETEILFTSEMSSFCGQVVTITRVRYIGCVRFYHLAEDKGAHLWVDGMFEGLVEEETKPKFNVGDKVVLDPYPCTVTNVCWNEGKGCFIYTVRGIDFAKNVTDDMLVFDERPVKDADEIIKMIKADWNNFKNRYNLPNGYHFVDKSGNEVNISDIVLEKKKKEYPKTYEECCKVLSLGEDGKLYTKGYKASLIQDFQKLLICRDAYWKIAGEEMGLGKPWEPDWTDDNAKYSIYTIKGVLTKAISCYDGAVFVFPTEEMRDAFKENFDPDIEFCKELL